MIMKNESSLSRAIIALVFLILATAVPSTSQVTNRNITCPVYELSVAERSKFEVETSKFLAMAGGTMLCTYPTNLPDPEIKFPLIILGHGGGAGGWGTGWYEKFMREVASSGFVVCAPRHCLSMCPDVFETHLRNAILAAKTHSQEDVGGLLPKLDGQVGVIGHSVAGISVLESIYEEHISGYGIKSAVLFDMTGVSVVTQKCTYDNWWDRFWNAPNNKPCGAGTRLERVYKELPLLFLATDANKDEHTIPTVNALLALHDDQPILAASIKDMTHNDIFDESYLGVTTYPAALKSVEYIIGFFTYTLKGKEFEACDDEFRTLLGAQLECNSNYYENEPFCHGEYDLFCSPNDTLEPVCGRVSEALRG
jgi:hypothetical protein